MTAAERISRLRQLIGDSAIASATGLDRRTIQRIGAGQATLHEDTSTALRRTLTEAAATAALDDGPPPVSDPRPFAAVLTDWLARHGLTAYAAAGAAPRGRAPDHTGPTLPATAVSIRGWVQGRPCPAERAYRALMTLIDEGRA